MNTSHKNYTATSAAVKAIGNWVSADDKAAFSKLSAVDTLVADGIPVSALVAPEKGSDTAVYDSYCAAIVTGFTPSVQKMLAVDSGALIKLKAADVSEMLEGMTPAERKAYRQKPNNVNRRYWQMQIGSKLKDLRKSLEARYEKAAKAEAEANMTDDEKAAAAAEQAASASDSAKLLRDVTAWINRLEKAEGTELPVVDCLKHLKALAGIATASMPN